MKNQFPLSNHAHEKIYVVQSFDSSLGQWLDTIHGTDGQEGIPAALETARQPHRWMQGQVGKTRIAKRKAEKTSRP